MLNAIMLVKNFQDAGIICKLAFDKNSLAYGGIVSRLRHFS